MAGSVIQADVAQTKAAREVTLTKQHAPKMWAYFDIGSSIKGSFNVSSQTRYGTGDVYHIPINAFTSNSAIAPLGTAHQWGANWCCSPLVVANTTSQIVFATVNRDATAAIDANTCHMLVCGTLA